MSSMNSWKPELYDSKLDFVSEYGKSVVALLAPRENETILDLGCGTGDLTFEIAQFGAKVVGMDLSSSMIEKARLKYPELAFYVGNAEDFAMEESFDAVFSNAALHWMKNPEKVIQCVWNVLNPAGRFVAEFGGKGNVETIIKAIENVLLEEYGMDGKKVNPWYYPSIGEYSTLLEQQGFRVTYAVHFDRPTPLKDGIKGLNHWLNSFGDDYFHPYSEREKEEIFQKIREKIKRSLFHDGSWYADYKRIRVVAIKP